LRLSCERWFACLFLRRQLNYLIALINYNYYQKETKRRSEESLSCTTRSGAITEAKSPSSSPLSRTAALPTRQAPTTIPTNPTRRRMPKTRPVTTKDPASGAEEVAGEPPEDPATKIIIIDPYKSSLITMSIRTRSWAMITQGSREEVTLIRTTRRSSIKKTMTAAIQTRGAADTGRTNSKIMAIKETRMATRVTKLQPLFLEERVEVSSMTLTMSVAAGKAVIISNLSVGGVEEGVPLSKLSLTRWLTLFPLRWVEEPTWEGEPLCMSPQPLKTLLATPSSLIRNTSSRRPICLTNMGVRKYQQAVNGSRITSPT
jgi:hypothetical protein